MPSVLGAFVRFLKATTSFVTSVRPTVRKVQLGSQWTDFDENLYMSFSREPVEKIQGLLKSDKNNGYFPQKRFHFYDNI
jgi:hypothetical protein